MRKRTNIELEMDFVEAIMRRFGLRTKTAAVDLALRRLAGEPMTKEEVLAMQGSMPDFEAPPDEPPVEII
jgi:Arc/MetJ family transcription regulator